MKTRNMPNGAIKVDLRDVHQEADGFSCGPAAAMPVFYWCGIVDPETLDEFRTAMKTTPENGTYYGEIIRYAKELGLDATAHHGMTKEQLKKLLDEGTPVILSMQAYASDPKSYDDPKDNSSGHFIVAVGYDKEEYFYFMDPSIVGRYGYLTWAELDKRWHENEGIGKEEITDHMGIVLKPKNPVTQLARKVE